MISRGSFQPLRFCDSDLKKNTAKKNQFVIVLFYCFGFYLLCSCLTLSSFYVCFFFLIDACLLLGGVVLYSYLLMNSFH